MSNFPLLIPLTETAKDALGGREHVDIDRLPFRIGRESRAGMMNGIQFYLERRKHNISPDNDLYLTDNGTRLHVSRRHAEIDTKVDGEVVIRDLGSRCGTVVDGVSIGGKDERGSQTVKEGSEVTIGTGESPFRFAIRHLDRIGGVIRKQVEPTASDGR